MTYEELLNSGKLRPVQGSLIGIKYQPELVDTGVVGRVKGRMVGDLVVMDALEDKPEDALVASTAVVVRRLGPDPEAWRSRFQRLEIDHGTTWAGQRVEEGTIVFARTVAQAPLGVAGDYVQLRYDDLAGVAIPLDEEPSIPCRPAPGFLLVKLVDHGDKVGSIYVKEDYADVLQEAAGMQATVAALPREDKFIAESGVQVGDIVRFPRYTLSEYIDLEGGYRLIHMEDVLTVEPGGQDVQATGG